MIKKYKMRKGCMYYINVKTFSSKWQERVYRWKLHLKGWTFEELQD